MRHLIRLYPKAWRARYGAELTGFIERRRATLGEAFDLVRGALDAHLHPALAQGLVFVPEIGFRPGGTRVLLERAEAIVDDTAVRVVAVAAAADRTDLLVEWAPPEVPGQWLVRIDHSGVHQRPPADLSTTLIAAGNVLTPLRVEHRFRAAGGYDLRDLTFAGVPPGAGHAELRITDQDRAWRVPFRLGRALFVGSPVAAET